ncbi:GNAT family N-acetyltransferase [Labrys sp. KNU-23]|uniref:GNAT family N-acetyltransferase n=1 Tax=Labrys sp. KNU-23 TaxID=2789216 RepID=UPI0011EFC4A0|nr:GNAT family N-acetyltransferase [Labrys sp. KNU-23]QEN86722.1 GNAT family N-acetyltransferase [Labrys sp. KNU-23]
MSEFSKTITDYWQGSFLGNTLYRDDVFTIAAKPDLGEESRVMVLEYPDGRTLAVLTPVLAERFDFARRQDLSAARFRQELNEAGLPLHGADHVFYFSQAGKSALLREAPAENVRRLTEKDSNLFAEFQAAASEQDLDNAYVELGHWAVFGAIVEGRLVCAASMYPWDEAQIADLGVLTLEPFRGRGMARKVVRAICRHACEQGYEPQYRCQLDNQASVALAKAAGVTLFGQWAPISPDAAG